jgi:steroid delta-isomerase-like uncharacterized protein
MPAPEQGS